MERVVSVWARLGRTRQMIVVLAAAAVVAGLIALSMSAARPAMTLLYANIEEGSAGEVLRALERRSVKYEVRGSSIYVPAALRDELRLSLAAEGLPALGGKGYELLDSLSGFGTTSRMFDAAYWRAKEGELARTIVASRYVARARVHIAQGSGDPFRRREKATASVMLVPAGAAITPEQAEAIRHLVASAVAGMAAEDVAVIDGEGNLIPLPGTPASATRAAELSEIFRTRILRLLEARVGPGNAVVEVSVETESAARTVRERRIDPESRVAISTDVEERSDSSSSGGGAVTVASDLPDGDAAGGGEGTASKTSSTRERVNYELSETSVEVVQGPGAIRRVTVAVLVNGVAEQADGGDPALRPRSDAELAALRELVEAAVGFDPERGDVVTLKSMSFPVPAPQGTAAAASWFDRLVPDVMTAVQTAVLALVVLILGLFVIRPILTRPPDALPAVAAGGEIPVLTGEIAGDGGDGPGGGAAGAAASGAGGTALPVAAAAAGDPAERLRAMIGNREEETVQILRGWLEERKETA